MKCIIINNCGECPNFRYLSSGIAYCPKITPPMTRVEHHKGLLYPEDPAIIPFTKIHPECPLADFETKPTPYVITEEQMKRLTKAINNNEDTLMGNIIKEHLKKEK